MIIIGGASFINKMVTYSRNISEIFLEYVSKKSSGKVWGENYITKEEYCKLVVSKGVYFRVFFRDLTIYF